MKVVIHTLVEDRAGASGLGTEHGLSLHVQVDGHDWLFDTGQSDLVVRNARRLGLDLSTLEGVVLSHGHYDHTGGLDAVLRDHGLPVYAHPDVLRRRFSVRDPLHPRDVGCPHAEAALERLGGWLRPAAGPAQPLSPRVVVASNIPRTGEGHVEPFLVVRGEDGGFVPDPFDDEQFLLIRTPEGMLLLLGCCHAGLESSLAYARALLPGQPVRAVIGGLHLRSASEAAIQRAIDQLEALNPELVAAGHCTGEQAEQALAQRLGERFRPLRAGAVLGLDS